MHYLFYLWAITWRSHKHTEKHRNPVEPKSLLSPEQVRQEPARGLYCLMPHCKPGLWCVTFLTYLLDGDVPDIVSFVIQIFCFQKNVLLFSFDLWVCALLIYHFILVRDLIFFPAWNKMKLCEIQRENQSSDKIQIWFIFLKCAYGIGWWLQATLLTVKA